MEFHEKLQTLRKQRGLTQEELAQLLYVSRTAISKWESGRGFPSIESLKTISGYFSVTIDELLSGEELLTIAEHDHAKTTDTVQDLVFGLLDCSMILLFFLPFFGQQSNGRILAVSLLGLTALQPYVKTAYLIMASSTILSGILTLALQNCRHTLWARSKRVLSLLAGTICVCLFLISRQPYAAVFTFVFLIIKTCMLIKHR